MGFKEVIRRVVAALRDGRIRHDAIGVAKGKNLLAIGEITTDEVILLLQRCRGDQYSTSPHHFDSETPVHVCEPVYHREQWYIKFYFLREEDDDLTLFMSVHKSVYRKRE